jgi:SAM-dependent methyltransferase
MANPKQLVVSLLRWTRLLVWAEHGRYVWSLTKNLRANEAFVAEHPDFPLPPSALAYDAYGGTSWPSYYQTGRDLARYFGSLAEATVGKPIMRICEWGCGPARILRHMPEFLAGRKIELFGFDFNPRTIDWCCQNLRVATFRLNTLAPPLPCEADAFDFLYCVSVFTHLSREMHSRWIHELSRVVKRDGMIVLTTHGNFTRAKLLDAEKRTYDRGELVVRDRFAEGKRCFVAYHPPSFVRDRLLRGFPIVSHVEGPILYGHPQDVWVVKNTKPSAGPDIGE